MPKNYAFMWAVNNYLYPPAGLQGCERDILDIKASIAPWGFSCSTPMNSQATQAAILAGMQATVNKAVSGDCILFYESGHGTKMKDSSGDEPDGFDECFVPYDAITATGKVVASKLITDDHVRTILNTVKPGVTVVFGCDSCYSGSATRCLDWGQFTPRVIAGPKTNGVKASKVVNLIPGLNHIAIEACTEFQTAAEGTVGGVRRGLFSYCFGKALRTYGATKTRAELFEIVRANVTKLNPAQTPIMECTAEEAGHTIFA